MFAKLIVGDCLRGLKKLENDSVDLCITSPPYNIGLVSSDEEKTPYPDSIDEMEYRSSIGEMAIEVARVIKPAGSFWLNMKSRWLDSNLNVVSSSEGSLEPPMWIMDFTRGTLFLKNIIIWHFDTGNDTRNSKFHPRHEFFFWFTKDPANYKFHVDPVRVKSISKNDPRNNENGANPTDVWYFPIVKGNSAERKKHPAQFPEKLVERIILSCSDEGDIVLDPYLGSGTTMKVALLNRRSSIGFEINPIYVEMAKKRVNLVASRIDDPVKLSTGRT
jgi:DNA modification methylase